MSFSDCYGKPFVIHISTSFACVCVCIDIYSSLSLEFHDKYFFFFQEMCGLMEHSEQVKECR